MKKLMFPLLLCLILFFSVPAFAASSAYQKETCKGNVCVLQILWTSSAEAMPNQVDRDFSGASAWADNDLASGGGSYDESDDLSLTAGAGGLGDYCTLPVASFPTTVGTIYNVTFTTANVTESWVIKSYDGTQTIGTVTGNGAQYFEWTATTTGGLRIVAGANSAVGDFDDFSMGESFDSFQTQEINAFIDGVETDPSGTYAPTDNYDISIANTIVSTINSTSTTTLRAICGDTGTWTSGEITTNSDGVLADRDTANSEFTRFSDNSVYGGVYNIGPLLVDITHEGRSKSGVINIWYKKID